MIALLGIVLLAIDRWMMIGAIPPGLDGAQWLAIGRGFHGVGRSSAGVYPPLTPILATAAESVMGPLPALRVLAVATFLLLGLAIWVIARAALGPIWALLVAAIALPASALAEPLMYGGYPQQIALAMGLIALWAACWHLTTNRGNLLWIVTLTSLLAALAHHVYFPLILASIVVAAVVWSGTHSFRTRREMLLLLCRALFPSCVAFALIALRFHGLGYAAPLDATTRSMAEAWQYSTREGPALWLCLVSIGLVSLASTWRSAHDPAWIFAASLFGPAALLFAFTGQPRLAPPVLIGSAFAIGFGARQLAKQFSSARIPVVVVLAAAAAALIVPARHAVAIYADYYRVVDESIVAAAAAIEDDGNEGAVAVRADRRGWPIGWWFEALQVSPVLVGADEIWLAFPDERIRARQAAGLFDGDLTAKEFQDRVAEAGARYLVIPKWDWIGWERWTTDTRFPVSVIFDDDRYIVLRVADARAPR